jgi:RNA-splicing ligase RtcB
MSLNFQGKYTDCIVFNDEVEETAISQIYGFLNHEAFDKASIRIMSDVHAGAGAVIGFTSTFSDKIIPNVIGVDIACGIICIELGNIEIDFAALDAFIRKEIPSGCTVRSKLVSRHTLDRTFARVKNQLKLTKLSGQCLADFEAVSDATKQKANYVFNSLGSLGGGNHFLEIGIDIIGKKYLTIHTGSRNFGLRIAQHHQKIAKKMNPHGDLSFLEGEYASSYLDHMKVAQMFAVWNRQIIAETIADFLGVKINDYIESMHNYIDFERGVIRKGAVAAEADQLVVIPWNMRDGLVIGKGKGNPDWNYSAPHGAGRKMGRRDAKENLSLDEFKDTMKDVWSSCVGQDTLDEAPMAYKDAGVIESYLGPTVDIVTRVKPLYNFKASGD